MDLYIVRHGETEWNATRRYQGQADVPLTAAGLEQARLLAEGFPAERLDAVYSSPLARARRTAEPLARTFGCPLVTVADLRELDFGDFEGLTYDQIRADYPEQAERLFRCPDLLMIPHGETFAALAHRAMSALERIRARHRLGDAIAVVAHGAINKTMLAALMHIPLRHLWAIGQSNTAVSKLAVAGDWLTVEFLNSTSHLGSAPAGSV